MTIAEKIIKVRQDSGLSEEDFAKKLDISLDTLEKYESGESIPDDDLRVKISSEFSLSPDELYLDEEEQQALNMQTEPTIDQRLPYNPYAQQLPNPPYMAPAPVQKDKLFKSAALKIIAYPYLWAMAIGTPILIILLLISMAFGFKEESGSVGTSAIIPVISSLAISVLIYLLIFLINKKQYFQTFNMIGNQNVAEKYFPIFLLSNIFFPNMVSSIVTNIFDFVIKALGYSFLTNSANGISSVSLFSSLKSLLSLIISITVQYIVLKKLFLYIDSLSDIKTRNRVQKKMLQNFTAVTVIFAVIFIINICFFTGSPAVLILNIASMLLYVSMLILWIKLYKTPEIENNKAFMKILPYTVMLTQLSILLTMMFLTLFDL